MSAYERYLLWVVESRGERKHGCHEPDMWIPYNLPDAT